MDNIFQLLGEKFLLLLEIRLYTTVLLGTRWSSSVYATWGEEETLMNSGAWDTHYAITVLYEQIKKV